MKKNFCIFFLLLFISFPIYASKKVVGADEEEIKILAQQKKELQKNLDANKFFKAGENFTDSCKDVEEICMKFEGISDDVSQSDFSDIKDYIQVNGVAKFISDELAETGEDMTILRLTPRLSNAEGHIAGSAFFKIPFMSAQNNYKFSTFFRYRVTANNIFDGSGLVFIIQSDSRLTTAYGKCPYCMGFAGSPNLRSMGVRPSVGVEFDIQMNGSDTDYNMVGLDFNGALDSQLLYTGALVMNSRSGISEMPYTETAINNGIPWNVWIEYDGKLITVRSSQQSKRENATIHLRRPLNMTDRLSIIRDKGEEQEPFVFVGFSSDPGLYPAYTDILEWHFRPYYKPFGDYLGSDTAEE